MGKLYTVPVKEIRCVQRKRTRTQSSPDKSSVSSGSWGSLSTTSSNFSQLRVGEEIRNGSWSFHGSSQGGSWVRTQTHYLYHLSLVLDFSALSGKSVKKINLCMTRSSGSATANILAQTKTESAPANISCGSDSVRFEVSEDGAFVADLTDLGLPPIGYVLNPDRKTTTAYLVVDDASLIYAVVETDEADSGHSPDIYVQTENGLVQGAVYVQTENGLVQGAVYVQTENGLIQSK